MAVSPTLTLLLCLLIAAECNAFQIATPSVTTTRRSPSSLNAVIRPESVDFDFDVGQGGVRLAEESVIKLAGKVVHKPGSADPSIKELIRYTCLVPVDEKVVMAALAKSGATIVATGRGAELYKDPGDTAQDVVIYAPLDAVRDSLAGAGSAMQADLVVINFCGGDDAQVLEVLSAIKQLVLALDVATKAKVTFNSISHTTFPKGSSAVTVAVLPEGASTGGLEGVERAIAGGEVYFRDGNYYTLVEQDINPAVA